MDKRLGFVGIILENRKAKAPLVNEVLTAHGDIIIARTGLPYKEKNCSVITLIVDTTTDELGSLTGKLGAIEGVSVKSALSKGGQYMKYRIEKDLLGSLKIPAVKKRSKAPPS